VYHMHVVCFSFDKWEAYVCSRKSSRRFECQFAIFRSSNGQRRVLHRRKRIAMRAPEEDIDITCVWSGSYNAFSGKNELPG
jgi:hypothetical protein